MKANDHARFETRRRHGRHIHDHRFQWHIWRAPMAMALLSAAGLLFALVGDGWWDAVSWFGLGVPLAACLWFGYLKPRAARVGQSGR